MAMSNPDGQAAIPGSLREARNLATIITFSAAELAPGKVHRILSSEDVMEHGSTPVAVYASAQFHDPNPKLYAAAGNEGLDGSNGSSATRRMGSTARHRAGCRCMLILCTMLVR